MDRDIVREEFHTESISKATYGIFGTTITSISDRPHKGKSRGDNDIRATTFFKHIREGSFDSIYSAHIVELHLLFKVLRSGVNKVFWLSETSTSSNDIKVTKLCDSFLKLFLKEFQVGNIAFAAVYFGIVVPLGRLLDEQRADVLSILQGPIDYVSDHISRLLEMLHVAREDSDIGAEGGKLDGERLAKPSAAASDEDVLPAIVLLGADEVAEPVGGGVDLHHDAPRERDGEAGEHEEGHDADEHEVHAGVGAEGGPVDEGVDGGGGGGELDAAEEAARREAGPVGEEAAGLHEAKAEGEDGAGCAEHREHEVRVVRDGDDGEYEGCTDKEQ